MMNEEQRRKSDNELTMELKKEINIGNMNLNNLKSNNNNNFQINHSNLL